MSEPQPPEMAAPETFREFLASFFYGTRSNLNFKFLKDLSDEEGGQFFEDLLAAVADGIDGADMANISDVVFRWQRTAYSGHLGDPEDFPYRYTDTPVATLAKPLSESRVALMTSSGHFVAGDDPEPFGEKGLTQADVEARIGEFLKVAPDLSVIPAGTPVEELRVRHGGYPVQAVAADNQVVLPLGHMRDLAAEGIIGEFAANAYSFVGAASQVRLRKSTAPEWAQMLSDANVDAVVLVPI